MSVINEALKKLEDERSQRTRQDNGEYLAAPVFVARSTSLLSRLLWMMLGGVVVGVGVWTWTGSQWTFQLTALASPPAIVAPVPVVVPTQPTVILPVSSEDASVAGPVVPLPNPVVEPTPAVILPVSAAAPSVAGPNVALPLAPPLLPWLAPVWVRNAATVMSQGDRAAALQGWSQGLAKLSPKDGLIVLPASMSNPAAVALYRRLSGQFPALLALDKDRKSVV